MKKILVAFAALAGLAMAAAQDKSPDILVHLKFDDEAEAEAAADSSGHGHHGKLVKGPKRVAGKIGGGAMNFEGKEEYVELPNSEELDKVNLGSYSISAWYRPADTPPGTESDNNACYAIVVRTGWHEGLHFNRENRFVMEHWLKTDKPQEPKWAGAGTWEEEFAPGKWYHVAGVVDKAAGATRVYVNGELKNSGDWEEGANAAARDYGKVTWKVGIAAPGSQRWGWSAKAQIDDVRIYNRALSDADVKALFDAGK